MWRSIAITCALGCGSSTSTAPGPTPPATGTVAARPVERGDPAPPATTGAPAPASADRCEAMAVSELSIDGLLDDWREVRVLTRVGAPADGSIALRCAWDGTSIAFALDISDDRLVRVKGGQEDHVTLALSAGGKPLAISVFPANNLARSKITKPRKVEVADSLQPKGFSIELAIPAAAIPGYSASTPGFQLALVFHDSDAATGGDTIPLRIDRPIELGDRKELLDDFLATVRLQRSDVRLDTLVDLDPDRAGKERLVAGGTVIGVLTDQFAYVTLPAATAADVRKIELLPLGPRGQQVVAALVRQSGNGGARDVLMLWTVWSGQLQPLVNIEVRKELGGNLLEASWKLVKGKKGSELVVEPRPAVGFTAATFNEIPAGDSDPIVVPWDETRAGIAYTLDGAAIARRELPKKKQQR